MSILDLSRQLEPLGGTKSTFKKGGAKAMNEYNYLFFVSSLYRQMDKLPIITLVFVVLVLLFFLNHISVIQANTIPTTTKTTYKSGTTTSTYYASGISNPYKAQYYN